MKLIVLLFLIQIIINFQEVIILGLKKTQFFITLFFYLTSM